MNYQEKAQALWREAQRKWQDVYDATRVNALGKAEEKAHSVIAAALEQAYRDGVEALRDALTRQDWTWNVRERTKDIAARLLSLAKGEPK